MDILSLTIKNFINNTFETVSQKISDKFNIELSEVLSVLEDLNIEGLELKNKKKDIKSDDDEKEDGCVYTYTRKPRTGEKCGEKVSKKSHTKSFCTKHLQHENKNVKKTVDTNNTEEKNLVVKNKFGNYEHTSTGLLFRSRTKKIVYGKQGDDGEILSLTDDDIKIAMKHRFKIETVDEEED